MLCNQARFSLDDLGGEGGEGGGGARNFFLLLLFGRLTAVGASALSCGLLCFAARALPLPSFLFLALPLSRLPLSRVSLSRLSLARGACSCVTRTGVADKARRHTRVVGEHVADDALTHRGLEGVAVRRRELDACAEF